ncbi:MAG: hypothetical protein HPY53_07235 [Brevinematales bacterium]|nr:hypothetical protein [Brevinematales bacterium]
MKILKGKPKSGKTARFIDETARLLKSNNEPLVIVPGRFQKELFIKKLSAATGGFTGRPVFTLDEFIRATVENSAYRKSHPVNALSDFETFLIIRLIAEKRAPDFRYFMDIQNSPGIIRMLHSLILELRAAAILNRDVIHDEMGNPDKWHDIKLIYGEYERLLTEKGLYDYYLYTRTASEIIGNDTPAGYSALYFDGFFDFTAAQFGFVSSLIRTFENSGKPVQMAIPDTDYPVIGDTLKMFEKNFDVEYINIGEGNHPFSVLAERFLKFSKTPVDVDKIYEIDGYGKYREIELIACEIARLKAQGNLEYNDFAVVVRNPEEYDHLIDGIFTNFGIPFYYTKDKPLRTNPAIGYILHLFRCAVKGMDSVDLLSIANSGYTHNRDWKSLSGTEFLYHEYYQGTKDEWISYIDNKIGYYRGELENKDQPADDGDDLSADRLSEKLRRLTDFRDKFTRFVGLLFRFRSGDNVTFGEFNTWLFNLIAASGMERTIDDHDLKNSPEYWIVTKDYTAFQKLKKLLVSLQTALRVLESEKFSFDELYKLFTEIVKETRYRYEIFPGNCVKILTPYDLRETDFHTVFITGLNEGEFPGLAALSILNQNERIRLNERFRNMILPTEEKRTDLERFDFYIAVSRPTHNLYLCRNSFSEKGDYNLPSFFLNTIYRSVPQEAIVSIPPREPDQAFPPKLFDIVPTSEWLKIYDLRFFISTHHPFLGAELRGELRENLPFLRYADDMAAYAGRINRENEAFLSGVLPQDIRAMGILDDKPRLDTAIGTFQSEHGYSATMLETMGNCRYAFFMKYLLELKPETYPENTIRDDYKGIFLHEVLFHYVTSTINDDMNELPNYKMLDLAIGLALRSGKNGKSGGMVFDYEVEFYRKTLHDFVMFEKELRENYLPDKLEFRIENSELSIHGKKVRVQGKIDRIDKGDGANSYRIIDYKSGNVSKYSANYSQIPLRLFQLYLYAASYMKLIMKEDAIKELNYISILSFVDAKDGLVFSSAGESADFPSEWDKKQREIALLASLMENGNLSPFTVKSDFDADQEIPVFYQSKPEIHLAGFETKDKCGLCEFRDICRREPKREETFYR